MSNLEITSLLAEADLNRLALRTSTIELAFRLRPSSLVEAAVARVMGDAATAAGEVADAVRENGGKAALFGAGLLVAFGAGRGLKDPDPIAKSAPDDGEPLASPPASPKSAASRGFRSGFNALTSWAGAAGGAWLAYSLSNLVPVTKIERDLLGEVPTELKSMGSAFLDEHLAGAKQLIAGSFGIASFAASALGLMAAFAQVVSHFKSDSEPAPERTTCTVGEGELLLHSKD